MGRKDSITSENKLKVLIIGCTRLTRRIIASVEKTNPKAVLSHISNAKNQLIGPSDYQQFANDHFTQKVAEKHRCGNIT